jgi:hypothetical protein
MEVFTYVPRLRPAVDPPRLSWQQTKRRRLSDAARACARQGLPGDLRPAPSTTSASRTGATKGWGRLERRGPAAGDWDVSLVDDLIDWAQAQEGTLTRRPTCTVNSAGEDSSCRAVVAYDLPSQARRIIVANPSTYVWTDSQEDAPYGFDAWPTMLLRREHAAGYTSRADWSRCSWAWRTRDEETLVTTSPRQRQGGQPPRARPERFAEAQRLAEKQRWTFNGASSSGGVGHDTGG